ncbi:MAG: aspartate aminotransferase family protein [Actinomycetes bacterium]|jgi:4-aminobutyrate aminotransferase/(S)-3-amino-2-methylpropionate transaminase|nr:aspartate aminotransferase family protein [Actinomycetes bacterium]
MTDLRTALPEVKTALPGPKTAELLARRDGALAAPITSVYPLGIYRGAGAMFEDPDGNRFLDWVGGVGVLNVGYSNPECVEAVRDQAGRFFHAITVTGMHEGYVSLAERLNELAPTTGTRRKTMLANSGAEGVENAVKIARGATGRPNIIVFTGAFHGRTLLASTMTAKRAYSRGLGTPAPGVYRAPFPYLYRRPGTLSDADAVTYYLDKLRELFDTATPADEVAAIVVEPVQGEGGFVPAPREWVCGVREICDEYGIVLVADEVQTGIARSGKLYVSEYWREWGAAPDLIVTAKSLGAGVPISGVVGNADIMDAAIPGTLGGTYGGNPLACASAHAVLDYVQRENLCERAAEIGQMVRTTFESWRGEVPAIGDVRGIGSMLGVEYVHPDGSPWPEFVTATVRAACERGLVIESAGTYGNVIRFLCPLVVTDEQLAAGLGIYLDALLAVTAELG